MQLLNKLLRRPEPDSQPKTTLTAHLLSSTQAEYQAATQSPFLLAAAQGRLSKPVLGRWLAVDRLYFHSYIRAAGRLLASLDLPQGVPKSGEEEAAETRLVDWIVEDLVRIREVERQLVDVAARYGIEIGVEGGREVGPVKPGEGGVGGLPGVSAMEEILESVAKPEEGGVEVKSHPTAPAVLPWLEAAVMFWGTERCYVDAWSWARERQVVVGRGEEGEAVAGDDDADGGALRREFIPSWSSDELRGFVARLGDIIDRAVDAAVERGGKEVRAEVLRRVEGKWRSLVVAEGGFWPVVE
ncbi:heme oxygenase-like protein [Coniochaeta ligniaria NRRL 30616]|uniref:Heme oxygenase-like protein n=1 Tax=Coniochaeta ligniaria NRRL 30616 TaxID=1408157 RepID=A0A1J7JRP9_9PEZI|nr:heme oxygenase-like protein [Coniochaeta ligniaria NRRL 30616]